MRACVRACVLTLNVRCWLRSCLRRVDREVLQQLNCELRVLLERNCVNRAIDLRDAFVAETPREVRDEGVYRREILLVFVVRESPYRLQMSFGQCAFNAVIREDFKGSLEYLRVEEVLAKK